MNFWEHKKKYGLLLGLILFIVVVAVASTSGNTQQQTITDDSGDNGIPTNGNPHVPSSAPTEKVYGQTCEEKFPGAGRKAEKKRNNCHRNRGTTASPTTEQKPVTFSPSVPTRQSTNAPVGTTGSPTKARTDSPTTRAVEDVKGVQFIYSCPGMGPLYTTEYVREKTRAKNSVKDEHGHVTYDRNSHSPAEYVHGYKYDPYKVSPHEKKANGFPKNPIWEGIIPEGYKLEPIDVSVPKKKGRRLGDRRYRL